MAKIIINEFYRGSTLTTGDEFIELLLLEDLDATELNSFFVGDSSSAKAGKFSAYDFTNTESIANVFKAGTIIFVGGTGAFTQDTSYNPSGNDWSIALNAGGSFLPNANPGNNGDIAGDDVVWIDTANTGATISSDGFAVDIGTATGAFTSATNVNFGTSVNNTGYALNSDAAGATNTANWTTGIPKASTTPGLANGGTNTTYIESLRNSIVNAGVTLDQSGITTINEEGETTTTYTISLNSQPVGDVVINVTADGQTQVSATGSNFSNTATLTLNSANLQGTITVKAVNDSTVEPSPHTGVITQGITSSNDPNYPTSLNIANVNVNILDNDVALTFINQIQGNSSTQGSGGVHNDVSPFNGQTVTIEGVVVADFQATNQLRGFFIQEENVDADADGTTSEGIFVFTGNTAPLDVQEGQIVRLTGTVSEFFGMTQITATTAGSINLINSGNNLSQVSPATIDLPAVGDIDDYYEQFEGMRVNFSDKLYVSEYFELARYGQIVLDEGGRPYQYTHIDDTPTAAEYATYLDNLERSRIILDDDDNIQNSPLPDGVIYYPQPGGLSTGTQGTNFFRGGDSINDLTGVLHWSFAGQSGTDAWRIRPTAANPVNFTVENPRPVTSPNPGGNIKVASFNVLNYFTSIDTTGGNNSPRGADSIDEFNRQNEKLMAALSAINADIFGLIEIENNGTAIAELVNRLNAVVGAGTYDYVNTGVVGTDQITVAIIYKPDVVQPKGSEAILLDPGFTDPNNEGQQRNRPAIAQTFAVIDPNNPDFGAAFNVVVNHFKSKGGSDATGLDTDQNDGQSQFNDTRTKAANYLVNTWLPSDPTGQGDSDFLIIGDLNSYKGENPITTIKNAGYTDLVETFGGNDAYSYVFDGQLGYLDHALGNNSLASQVTGVADWHINADEIPVFDYNNTIDDGAGESSFEAEPSGNNLYEPNAFRTSDHDPVIIGLDLSPILPTINITAAGNVAEAGSISNTFNFTRANASNNGDLAVNFTVNGSATLGTDYIVTGADFVNGTVIILNGQSSVNVTITPIDDVIAETSETIQLTLTQNSNYQLGNNITANLAITDNDFNLIEGTNRNDNLVGTDVNDRISADDGDDTILAGNGDDLVEGGRGGDLIRGGSGNDILAADRVSRFNDYIGNTSSLYGDSGNDSIYGGGKNDFIEGGSDNDVLYGKDGNDQILAGEGDDLLNGGVGNDVLNGESGVDAADYSDLAFNGVSGHVAGLDVNLSTGAAKHSSVNNGLSWTDTLINIENVIGTSYNDRFISDAADNLFDGGSQVGLNSRQSLFQDLDGDFYRVTADVVEYRGLRSNFTLVGSASNFTVTGSGIGTDTVVNIEFLKFDDGLFTSGSLFS